MEDYKKKYEEIIENIKEAKERMGGCVFSSVVDKIIPELKESEDEKIRKGLISFVRGMLACHNKPNAERDEKYESWIAWLEKQGEQKPVMSYDALREGITHFGITQYQIDNWLKKYVDVEKQGEQKPAGKVEPKFSIKYAGSEYNVLEVKDIAGVTYYGIEDEPNHIDYVQAENCEKVGGYSIKEKGSPYPTKPAKFSEQKPAWSEEDEKMWITISDLLWEGFKLSDGKVSWDKIRCWLLPKITYFKDRVQTHPKQEWSEEDENGLGDALWAVQQARSIAKDENEMGGLWYAEKWLKSLKERYTWKPSDEQMKALEYYIEKDIIDKEGIFGRHIIELYAQLKKLK